MTQQEIDIADMQCRVFRIARVIWNLSSRQCVSIFHRH